ncbi:MAG TPA: reverse transcriptase domain-containing protein [Bacteroidota bacterium]|nr:reverse transcriptase domain-containing protein [Bacteroidota bacterium]
MGFSYGFRPGRSPHQALDALAVGIGTKPVNWVLDADIRKFYDTLDHGWRVRFIEHRIADRRVVRLIQKWLKAGVLEEGKRVPSEIGTVQGGSISPLLSNIYLHYTLDLWVQRWRQKQACGEVIFVRFADDFVAGFEHRHEAEQFLAELSERCCMPTKRESSSSAAGRNEIVEIVATAHRRRSTSWVLRTVAGKPGRGTSRCCDRRCGRGGKPSCGL